jgi:competence protein ComEA
VNSAPAAELSGVIGIPIAMAQAIVSYRDTHGRFADLEALLKVPGLDKPAIEAQLYALRFD